MRRIRVMLLTLVLSISMLAPEFSMLPAAYAQDQTPAVAQEAAEADSQNAPKAAGPAVNSDSAEAAGTSDEEAVEDSASGNAAPAPAAAEEPAAKSGPYDRLTMIDLDDGGSLVIPEDMKEAITKLHSRYGDCVLLEGKVGELNKVKLGLGEFNFNEGSAGRLSFDGLKDKDSGMTVKVQVYLDDEAEPVSEFALKKQMGKKEWSNDGERSVSLGSRDISGTHTVSLGFSIEGKKDTAKTTVALRSLQFCKTTVPVMYFNIDESEGTVEAMNSSGDHSVECYGNVDLVVPDAFNADETFRDEYGTQKSLYGLELEYIRGRGNSTWDDPKKPYKVKFDKGQNLFGFGKNKHWVLLANRYDNSLVRNRMTYWLGQQLGMEYTPQCVPVDVVMNGEYYGSYLLCEQIRVGEGRVTIDDLDDIKDVPAITDELIKTGGYLLSMDFEEDEHLFTTDNNMNVYIESPDENVAYFYDYIKAYVQKVENAILSDDFKDAEGKPYTDYLDMDAAVDYWWVQEFSCNGDAYGSGSTYMYKKRDSETGQGKLYWGPLWDFDFVAWGDLNYDEDPPEELDYTGMSWFEAMKTDPEFIEKVKTRWSEKGGLRDKLVEITKEGGRLDKYLAQMETSYDYDHAKWGAYDSSIEEYKGEIEQLRTWIIKRIENVDKALNELKVEEHTVTFKLEGKVISTVTVKGFLRKKHMPEVPEKAGYVFGGWTNLEDENEIYEEGAPVKQDLVLIGEYVKESEVVQPKNIYFRNYNPYVVGMREYGDESFLGWYFPETCVMPEEAADTELTWTSSDENIAIIEDEIVKLRDFGEVTITATAPNGVSNSLRLHIVRDEDIEFPEEIFIDRESLTLKVGEYTQLLAVPSVENCYEMEPIWLSDNENIATVNEIGVIKALSPGETYIMMLDTDNRAVRKCKLTVKAANNKGAIVKRAGNTYKITSDKKGSRKAMLIKAKNASKVTVPAFIKYDGKKYSITKIKAKAFAKSKATRLFIRTKKLSKARVKNSLKGSKVKKIYVRGGKAKTKHKYIKKYKKIFTKKNAGKAVVVSNN